MQVQMRKRRFREVIVGEEKRYDDLRRVNVSREVGSTRVSPVTLTGLTVWLMRLYVQPNRLNYLNTDQYGTLADMQNNGAE